MSNTVSTLSLEANSHIQALSAKNVSPQMLLAAEEFFRYNGDSLNLVDSDKYDVFYEKLVAVQEANPKNPEANIRTRKKKGIKSLALQKKDKKKRGFG